MIQQYPHYLYVRVATEAGQDNDGNFVANDDDSWQLHSMCREESNGKGSVINGIDGKAVVFSSAVYLPKSAASIEVGTEVVVSQFNDYSDGVRIQGQVLKFDSGQLHGRLWV